MARSGLIRLAGLPVQPYQPDSPRDNREFVGVEILDERHLIRSAWDERVEPVRQRILADNAASLTGLLEVLSCAACPADIVSRIYPRTQKFCSGCSRCRERKVGLAPAHGQFEPRPPWPLQGVLAPALRSFAPSGRLVVGYDATGPDWETSLDRWQEAVEMLDLYGLRQALVLGDVPQALTEPLESHIRSRPWALDNVRMLGEPHLPDGAKLLLVGGGNLPARAWLEPGQGDPVLILIPSATPSLDNPRVPLRATLRVQYLPFEAFIDRLCA